MVRENTHFLFRLLNIWFAFLAVLLISSHFPHWDNIPFQVWINEAAYFFLFLLSLALAVKDSYNRDIFVNLCVLFVAHAFSFVNIFLGNDYLLGNVYTQWYFFIYRKILLCFLFNFSIMYIVFKYVFPGRKLWKNYSMTLLLIAPIFLYNFMPYLADLDFGFTLENVRADLFKRILYTDGLSLVFIPVYGIVLYRTDRILGTWMNWLMAAFFVFGATSIVEMYSKVYGFQIFSISVYILMTNLIFISVILFKKMLFHLTAFGQFYEDLVHQNIDVGKVKFQRYKATTNALILQVIRIYVSQRKNYLFALVCLTALGFAYFRLPWFFTLNIVAILGCFILIFWFLCSLSKKRAEKEYIIHS